MVFVHVLGYAVLAFIMSVCAYTSGQGVATHATNPLLAAAVLLVIGVAVGRLAAKRQTWFIFMACFASMLVAFPSFMQGVDGHLGYSLFVTFAVVVGFCVGVMLVYLSKILMRAVGQVA